MTCGINLTAAQKAFVANGLRDHYDAVAKERQGTRTDLKPDIVINLPQSESPKARDQAGLECGVNGSYVDMARDIEVFRPDLKAEVETGALTITKAASEARKVKNIAKQRQVESKIGNQNVRFVRKGV